MRCPWARNRTPSVKTKYEKESLFPSSQRKVHTLRVAAPQRASAKSDMFRAAHQPCPIPRMQLMNRVQPSVIRPSAFFPLACLDIIPLHQTRIVHAVIACKRSEAHSAALPPIAFRHTERCLRTLQQPHCADPLPHPPNISSPALSDHRPHIRVALHQSLHSLPQNLPPVRRELLAQDVIPQLCYTHVVLFVHIRLSRIQRSLVAQLLQRKSRELLRTLFRLVA